jgi:D-alanyl-D-alanine carboxypeptidase (penicillin-binding protein 5/6)
MKPKQLHTKITKTSLLTLLVAFIAVSLAPKTTFALEMPQSTPMQMPQNGNDLAGMVGIQAQAYIVQDVKTGQILISKNEDMQWTPASLTKLVTALVVLDTKPKLTKSIAITKADETIGACKSGGACIQAVPGTKFTVDGLFHAALLPSANNAANALARSTGLTPTEFAARMNKKAAALGATGSHFFEPTGMDPDNKITAADYAKIVVAAFSNTYLKNIDQLKTYTLNSTNNRTYDQTIKNTDKLLTADGIQMLGAKTGYLDQAKYNFASILKYNNGPELSVVVLGENHLYVAFAETKELANLAEIAQTLSYH